VAGKTVGEAGQIPLFFTLIPILALLSNYDQENCLINVGTEGWVQRRLMSLWCWINSGVQHPHFVQSPTILAWDLGALCRILPIEARSP
jgi:hypothetical protein